LRDLAHEENMKVEEEFKRVKSKKRDLKDKIAAIKADLTKAKFSEQRFDQENAGLRRSMKESA
jgi:hypothetical protein